MSDPKEHQRAFGTMLLFLINKTQDYHESQNVPEARFRSIQKQFCIGIF